MVKNTAAAQPGVAKGLYHLDTPADDYDINFILSLPSELKSDLVSLELFIPSLHAEAFYKRASDEVGTELWRYLPYGPFDTFEDYLTFLESFIRRDPGSVQFLIKDHSEDPEGKMAGVMGFARTVGATTEIANVYVFQEYHGTHVISHGTHILLKWAFQQPSQGGPGMRRVQWTANALNIPSNRAAAKLGFRHEGTLRWDKVLGVEKVNYDGLPPPPFEEDEAAGKRQPARHMTMLAICWDDWVDGDWEGAGESRRKIEALVNRGKVVRVPRDHAKAQ